MSWKEYYAGVRFIKNTSGTGGEAVHRLKEWKKHALPLVNQKLNQEQYV